VVSNRSSLRARGSSTAQPSSTARVSAARASLPAREVHDRLRSALADLQRAERNAVLWFSEIARRKLYRDLGYASIHQYAELALGFKKSKTSQFLRLSESLKELPGLRRSVAKGELSWTKAREVAKVATPQTETAWIREAKQANSRALEAKVMETRQRARDAGSAVRGQGELAVIEVPSGPTSANSTSGPVPEIAPSVPMDVHFRMTPEQYARFQALVEAIRKRGRREDRTELMLAALEQLALDDAGRVADDAKPSPGPKDGLLAPGRQAPGQPNAPEFTRVNPNVA
jgi:hypothetical protein